MGGEILGGLMTNTHTATIEDGKLTFDNEKRYRLMTGRLKDGKYVVEIKGETRSAQANRHYWAMLKVLGNEIGYTSEEMHVLMKVECEAKAIEVDVNGQRIIERTTRTMTTKEFYEYKERVFRWASENGYYVPSVAEFERMAA